MDEFATLYERPSASSMVKLKFVKGTTIVISETVSGDEGEFIRARSTTGIGGYLPANTALDEVDSIDDRAGIFAPGMTGRRKSVIGGAIVMVASGAAIVWFWNRGWFVGWIGFAFAFGLGAFIHGLTRKR